LLAQIINRKINSFIGQITITRFQIENNSQRMFSETCAIFTQ
jgi:hypothetical protein